MIRKEKFNEIVDDTERHEVVEKVEEMIDSGIIRVASGMTDLPILRVAEYDTTSDPAMHRKRLGELMDGLSDYNKNFVRKKIVEMYSKEGYRITWKREDVGFDKRAYVIRINGLRTPMKMEDE